MADPPFFSLMRSILFNAFDLVPQNVLESFTYVGTCQFREREIGEKAETGPAAQGAAAGHANFPLGHQSASFQLETNGLVL